MEKRVLDRSRLEKLASRLCARGATGEVALSLSHPGSGEVVHVAAGQWQGRPIDERTPFHLASTTKLFATTLVLQLVAAGTLRLDDPAAAHLPAGTLDGLHTLDGVDRTGAITIRHLLSHRSGLPDYFEGKRPDGTRFAVPLLEGRDKGWSLPDALAMARQMRPHFAPGEGRKALYSDTNYAVLALIIGQALGCTPADAVRRHIAAPLGLVATYLAQADGPRPVLPMRNGRHMLHIPQAVASTVLDGGGISTSAELLTFIEAFFSGRLFPAPLLDELYDWRAIFFPLQAGVGVKRFALPWFMSPFQRQPELIGHSGISGAFAFRCPDRGLFLAGTVNQLAARSLPYRFMIEAVHAVRA